MAKEAVSLVKLDDETIGKLAEATASAMTRRLTRMMFAHARLTAADVIHTTLKPDTVFRYAMKEAEQAQAAVEEYYRRKAADAAAKQTEGGAA